MISDVHAAHHDNGYGKSKKRFVYKISMYARYERSILGRKTHVHFPIAIN